MLDVAVATCHQSDANAFAWDDVAGASLKPELVKPKRGTTKQQYMEYFMAMQVYTQVSKTNMLGTHMEEANRGTMAECK